MAGEEVSEENNWEKPIAGSRASAKALRRRCSLSESIFW